MADTVKKWVVMSLDRLPSQQGMGPHRATFSVDGGPEHTVVAITKMQALDKAVFDKIKAKCTELRFLDEETDEVFSISIEDFEQNAVIRDFDGKQMFVSKKFWKKKLL